MKKRLYLIVFAVILTIGAIFIFNAKRAKEIELIGIVMSNGCSDNEDLGCRLSLKTENSKKEVVVDYDPGYVMGPIVKERSCHNNRQNPMPYLNIKLGTKIKVYGQKENESDLVFPDCGFEILSDPLQKGTTP